MSRPRYYRVFGDWYVAVKFGGEDEITFAVSLNWHWRHLSLILGWVYLAYGRFHPVSGSGIRRLRIVR